MNRAPTGLPDFEQARDLVRALEKTRDSAPILVRQTLGVVLDLLGAWIVSVEHRLNVLEGRINPQVLAQLLAPVPADQRGTRVPNVCFTGENCTRGCTRGYCYLRDVEREIEP